MEANIESRTQPTIAIDKLPLSYEALKPWLSNGCVLQLEVGPTGKPLQEPVKMKLTSGLAHRDIDIINYVAQALSGCYPKLVSSTVQSSVLMKLATYLRRNRTSSQGTLRQYIYDIHRFCKWLGKSPNQIVASCMKADGTTDTKAVKQLKSLLDEYVGELQAGNLAPSTINHAIHAIKTMLRVNDIDLPKIMRPMTYVKYPDRAPKPDELTRMLLVADPRGRVIVSCLALGGFREITLANLTYGHVKEDLEQGIIPIHVHVEAALNKGKYADYDTFLGQEAVEYIKAYMDYRKRGSPCGKIPPERLIETAPLIRNEHAKEPKPVSRAEIYHVVHSLYFKAGLIEKGDRKKGEWKLYPLRGHSIRKYFRTQLAALGVPRDYIEFMMGHKISTYHDIKMKGIDFLRNIYAASGLSIKPKTQVSRIDMLKEIIRAWGMDPERLLVKEALAEPHRVYAAGFEREENHVKALSKALRQMMREELLNSKSH